MKKTLSKFLVKINRSREGVNVFKDHNGNDIEIVTEILSQNAGYYATMHGEVVNIPEGKRRRRVEYVDDKWKYTDTDEFVSKEFCECTVNYNNEVGYTYVEEPVLKQFFRYDTDIKVGDVIYFHHHVADEANMVEPDIYACEFRQIFGRVRDGVFTSMEEWVFCEPVMYEGEVRSSGLLIPHLISKVSQKGFEGQEIGKWHPSEAIVKYVPEYYKDHLQPGDRISFIKNADYDMKVEGDVLFRINIEHMLYIC